MIYKRHKISEFPNEWGFFEAYDINDCDASMEHAKTLEQIKIYIDDVRITQEDAEEIRKERKSSDFPPYNENEFMFI